MGNSITRGELLGWGRVHDVSALCAALWETQWYRGSYCTLYLTVGNTVVQGVLLDSVPHSGKHNGAGGPLGLCTSQWETQWCRGSSCTLHLTVGNTVVQGVLFAIFCYRRKCLY